VEFLSIIRMSSPPAQTQSLPIENFSNGSAFNTGFAMIS